MMMYSGTWIFRSCLVASSRNHIYIYYIQNKIPNVIDHVDLIYFQGFVIKMFFSNSVCVCCLGSKGVVGL